MLYDFAMLPPQRLPRPSLILRRDAVAFLGHCGASNGDEKICRDMNIAKEKNIVGLRLCLSHFLKPSRKDCSALDEDEDEDAAAR
jgi:hypothetical protein